MVLRVSLMRIRGYGLLYLGTIEYVNSYTLLAWGPQECQESRHDLQIARVAGYIIGWTQ